VRSMRGSRQCVSGAHCCTSSVAFLNACPLGQIASLPCNALLSQRCKTLDEAALCMCFLTGMVL
jgi:hypothetical protein